MAIWDDLKNSPKREYFNTLHQKLAHQFPEDDEEELSACACIAGLLASTALSDLIVHEKEKAFMVQSLVHWMDYPEEKAHLMAQVASEDARELVGMENHTYTRALSELLDKNQRYGLLETLFEMAASDGGVSERESEHIRTVCRGLGLEHHHFVSAKAQVLEFLDSLRKTT